MERIREDIEEMHRLMRRDMGGIEMMNERMEVIRKRMGRKFRGEERSGGKMEKEKTTRGRSEGRWAESQAKKTAKVEGKREWGVILCVVFVLVMAVLYMWRL